MNNKALTLSLVMAIMAVFFVQSYVSSIEEEAKKKFGTEVLVLKAKKDIKEMDSLNETMFELGTVPKRFLEPAAISFQKSEEAATKSLKNLTGLVAIVPIKRGEQITYTKIQEPSIRTGLSPQVTPGKRAVAIPVSETSGVGKLVKPGDRVDVIAIIDPGQGKDSKLAKTVLQDVVVLAVGKNVTNNVPRLIEPDAFGGKDKVRSLAEDFSFASVTLEVEPFQAQALLLMMSSGDNSLNLSLRNNDDNDRVNLGSTTYGDILGPDALRIQQRNPAAVKR